MRAMRSGSLRWFLGFLAVVAAIAGFEIYSLVAHNRERAASAPKTETATRSAAKGPIGDIDATSGEALVGPRVTLSGWALDPSGIRAVEVRVGGRAFAATTGISRPDVAKAKPDIPNNTRAGYEFTGDFSVYPAPAGADRRTLSVVAVASDGRETVLGTRSLIEPSAMTRWAWLPAADATPFYLLPALSGIDLGGAAELDSAYKPYLSSTLRAGFRVPILYLRMTKGAHGDYAFDPDWDATR
jgi:hypothetical protein